MEVIEAIKARKSIRGYRPDPVPRELLTRILVVSMWAPSADNSQPWEFAVVSGEPLARLGQELSQKIARMDEFSADIPFPFPNYPPFYMKRCKENAKRLFEVMGIAREDIERRLTWAQKGTRFFDAPAALILYV